MLIPFHVTIPTANTAKKLFSTTDNLILASMISGASNTTQMFNVAPPTGPFGLSRLNFTCDTASVSVVLGVFNGVGFYEIWRSLATDTATTGVIVDEDFTPKSRSIFPVDYLAIPQSNSYVPAMKLSTTPGGNVNIQGFMQIVNLIPGAGTFPPIVS